MDRTGEADIGGIFAEMISLVRDNARAVLLFLAVVGGFSVAGALLGLAEPSNNLAGFNFGFLIDETDTLASGIFQLALAVLSIVASYLLAQALLAERGRLAPGGTRIWAYVGLSIVSAFGFVLGFILLIVPGLILMVRWSAATGYLIGERTGVIESLSESWDATRGHGWPIFLVGLVLFVGFLIVARLTGALAGLAGSEALIAVLSALAEAIGSALSVAFGIAVYLLVNDATAEIEGVFA